MEPQRSRSIPQQTYLSSSTSGPRQLCLSSCASCWTWALQAVSSCSRRSSSCRHCSSSEPRELLLQPRELLQQLLLLLGLGRRAECQPGSGTGAGTHPHVSQH